MASEKSLPKHVAIIMDGNGRWAKKKMMPRIAGHSAGMEAMKKIVRKASNMGIEHLTVYAFSTENWKRSEEEIGGIFKLLVKYVASDLQELCDENVRVRVLGDYSKIPEVARNSLDKTIKSTEDNTGLGFNIALNYGSRVEITRAINAIVERRLSEEETVEQANDSTHTYVTEEEVSEALYTGSENGNIPDPDLIIRTSGEKRLSNFMLWQSAYSELAFTDVLWPDFTPEIFEDLIMEYCGRERRYGGRLK